MKQKRILLPTIDDAKMFVAAATQCDFDIDVYYNRVVIDAKSILGIMGIGVRNNFEVYFDGKDKQFQKVLDKFAVV